MDAYAAIGHITPSITKMIRMDHSHVLVTAHGYEVSTSPRRKQAIVDAACAALEIHAQLEEEIFYPALRDAGFDSEVLDRAQPEHDAMRKDIAELRTATAGEAAMDERFMALMRDVMHHVAEEETVLLPAAERLLANRLGELGARMTQRRIALLAPRAAEVAVSTAVAMPLLSMVVTGSLLATVWHWWHSRSIETQRPRLLR